ncbi:MAG: flavodoxin-dependent (E)-4-hydroxy-3-methylbut-2-enyl-diphosphate synthase [Firmicutes bacterium]|nr:flavodoxin-dependent (E)-4-hydroxy-3-methylbut-2-enyl-diphosphate synthase [Bacillota bacterium]
MTELLAKRRISRSVMIGNVQVGGGAPLSIQSMNNTRTADIPATLAQLQCLAEAGCQIGRLAVADIEDAAALPKIVRLSPLPLVADIHFDHRLALASVKAGIAGLRINPGNIGGKERVHQVAQAAKAAAIPIRVGVNGGSLEKDLLQKYGGITAETLVESAGRHIEMLEDTGFFDIKISLKASRLPIMLAAFRQMAAICEYPLHIGVTEAGLPGKGSVKSALGIGSLLAQGIGDTLRVSLTGDPLEEVRLALDILHFLELKPGSPEVISCPTCGRTTIDVAALATAVQKELTMLRPIKQLTIAIMGCAVNGPGEAREADFGVAGASNGAVLFAKGEIIGRYEKENILPELLRRIGGYLNENE